MQLQFNFLLNFVKIGVLIGLIHLATSTPIFAQQGPPSGGRQGNSAQMNIGRFYGKIVDDKGKGVSFAAVQLWGMKFNPETKKPEESLLAGQITKENGDFSLEKLPIKGDFTLKVSLLGYAKLEQVVTFGIPGGKPEGGQGGGRPSGGWAGGGGGNFDKDLGNIALATQSFALDEVVIEGEASTVTLALDKRVYRVDKDLSALGGTAEDALKNVPSLAVDIDGNLSLRNSSPQLFIDGRPTTLTLDQISSDEIESVEVITNPSAKYDASGGQAGIVNIVLKKERRIGYNGNIRAGVDSRGGLNGGGNLNAREGKINVFLSANLNQRKSIGEGETDRQNLLGNPKTNVLQLNDNEFTGTFLNFRGGLDWFIDNRNTITFSGSFTKGNFLSSNDIRIKTDSLFTNSATTYSEAFRSSENDRGFQNVGGSVLFKHLFPKDGKEWTADINYNSVTSQGLGDFSTEYFTNNFSTQERQESDGGTQFLTVQTDYVDQLTKAIKLELGARAALRNFDNSNISSVFDPNSQLFVRAPNFADEYEFQDAVYAAYATFSHSFEKWGYMLGLRAESSQYTGTLPESGDVFKNDYPLSLFPSIFVTRKLNKEDNLQFSYTRRISRPNFFQLMPFTDFSDSLNLKRGNPDLIPEFTNSVELTYQNILSKGNDFLISAYFKQASDLITTYQFTEAIGGKEVLITSYANSNNSEAYGVEFTMRNTIIKGVELTSNANFYNSKVDASNIEVGLINEQFTFFVKENLSIRLPASFRLQISGQYQSKAAFTPSNGGGRFSWRGGPTQSAQGYTIPNWFVDISLRKDLFKRKASVSLSVRDVFASRERGSFSQSAFFIQDTWSIRNPQLFSLNFFYRFGKPDVSLFKRKNNNMNSQGNDMM